LCGNAQHIESAPRQNIIASLISNRLIAKIMPTPIDLNDQASTKTCEIRRNPANRELTTKLEARRSLPKLLP